MGLFMEKDQEKNYKNLFKLIKSRSLDIQISTFLINYLKDIQTKNRNNDFIEYDFLEKVILEIILLDYENYDEFETIFHNLITKVKFFLPEGQNTENYDGIKNMIINHLIKKQLLLENSQNTEKLYSIFATNRDVAEILMLIYGNNKIYQHYTEVVNFIVDVAPYCYTNEILKAEVIAFLSGFDSLIDYDRANIADYCNMRIMEAKKRVGIYQLDEKDLARVADTARKAQNLLARIDNLLTRTNNLKNDVNDIGFKAKKNILEEKENIIKEITELKDTLKADIISELQENLKLIQQDLQTKSDAIFTEILNRYQKRIDELKLFADALSANTSRSLTKIRDESEASISKLKDYVLNQDAFKELLKDAKEDEDFKLGIIALREMIAEYQKAGIPMIPTGGVVIPDINKVVVPDINVVIPQGKISRTILEAFDESIPFSKRIEKILKEKEQREKNGELFHEMTMKVVVDLMEGDFPYLWGPSGCGKSYAISQIASLLGINIADNGKITDKYSIMAYNDPNGNFRATQSFIALAYGQLLSLEEFDNGNTDTQVVINGLYSALLDVIEKPNIPRFVTFAENTPVRVNPNFRLIATGNTSGLGETGEYSARGKSDESVLERLTPVKYNYDNRIEKGIFGSNTGWYEFFTKFRLACDAWAISRGLETAQGIGTTRDAASIVRYINHNSKSIDQIMEEKFIQIKDEVYLQFLEHQFSEYYNFDNISVDDYIGVPNLLKDASGELLAKKFIQDCKRHRALERKEGR